MNEDLTDRQRAALLWLTDDWQFRPRHISAAADSLSLYHGHLVESRRRCHRVQQRLSTDGIRARAALAGKEGKP